MTEEIQANYAKICPLQQASTMASFPSILQVVQSTATCKQLYDLPPGGPGGPGPGGPGGPGIPSPSRKQPSTPAPGPSSKRPT
ncbi:hypothetical protein BDN67DRAFT_1015115 [Paxillus ammoniavirescens]|nr:hypothetical protein BDN67DRAFT_1015115 [Paxillus ammoniavirescens]